MIVSESSDLDGIEDLGQAEPLKAASIIELINMLNVPLMQTTMPVAGIVWMQVVDEGGKPVAGVRVRFFGGSKTSPQSGESITGADGNAKSPILASGSNFLVSDARYKFISSKVAALPEKTVILTVRPRPGIIEKPWGWIIPPEPGMVSTMALVTYRICDAKENPVETLTYSSGGYNVEMKPGYKMCSGIEQVPTGQALLNRILAPLVTTPIARPGSTAAPAAPMLAPLAAEATDWKTYALIGAGVLLAAGLAYYFLVKK